MQCGWRTPEMTIHMINCECLGFDDKLVLQNEADRKESDTLDQPWIDGKERIEKDYHAG